MKVATKELSLQNFFKRFQSVTLRIVPGDLNRDQRPPYSNKLDSDKSKSLLESLHSIPASNELYKLAIGFETPIQEIQQGIVENKITNRSVVDLMKYLQRFISVLNDNQVLDTINDPVKLAGFSHDLWENPVILKGKPMPKVQDKSGLNKSLPGFLKLQRPYISYSEAKESNPGGAFNLKTFNSDWESPIANYRIGLTKDQEIESLKMEASTLGNTHGGPYLDTAGIIEFKANPNDSSELFIDTSACSFRNWNSHLPSSEPI